MTVFLCILALLALDADIKAKGDAWPVFLSYALHVVLCLGLSTLALVSYLS